MSARSGSRRLRAVGLAEAAAGAVVLARAATVVRALRDGAAPPAPVVAVARVLGARMLAQGLLAAAVPDRRIGLGGAATDLSHALSMVPVVWRMPAHRRPALSSAVVAIGFAAAQAATAPRRSGTEGTRL